MNNWFEEYMMLVLRIDKVIRLRGGSLIESYLGPQNIIRNISRDNKYVISDLVAKGKELIDRLYELDIKAERKYYIEKQVYSMISLLEYINGNNEELEIVVNKCMDINLEWVDDSHFEQGLSLIEEGLKCDKDNLFMDYRRWQKKNRFTGNVKDKKKLIDKVIEEIYKRTSEFIVLPQDNVNINFSRDNNTGAIFRYQGEYNSSIQLGRQSYLDLIMLLPLMCHEIYPGHHTEYTVKEALYSEERPELSFATTLSPQLVISEGLAECAFDILFDYTEAGEWIARNIFTPLDINTNNIDIPLLLNGLRNNTLDQISNNIIIMINNKCSMEEIFTYTKKYTMENDFIIKSFLRSLDNPYRKLYSLSYFKGKQIIKEHLSSSRNIKKEYKNILSNPVYPSLLV